MTRRKLLHALGAGLLIAGSLPARAQSQGARVPVVGILNSGAGPRSDTVDVTRQSLAERGYVEGRTIAFDVRFAATRLEAFPVLAADLVRRNVDVILVSGPAGVRAARDATRTIPIVALDFETDPVQAGFARSLAQPGGNLTGCFLDHPGLTGKWLELMGEAAPRARRLAVLRDATTGPWQLAAIQSAAHKLGVDLRVTEITSAGELDRALEAGVSGGAQGLVQLSSPLFDIPLAHRIAGFSSRHRLPAISMFKRFPRAGGLMSYGPNQPEYYRRLAAYIDKILRGAKPADLPIEQPDKFDLVVNLTTAAALGLAIPQTLLLRADEAIR